MFHQGEAGIGSGQLRPGRINLRTSELEAIGTSLMELQSVEQGILHRTCEQGRRIAPNATMLAVQMRGPVLETKDQLKPLVVDLVNSLRQRAVA